MSQQKLTATIECMAQEGYGLARCEGKVYFIPDVLPSEKVLFQVQKEKKTHGFGKLCSLEVPSPKRKKATCPHFGTCGGCHFQHMQYPYQLEIKKKVATETFQKISGLSLPFQPLITASPNEYFYRNHIRLKIENLQIGYQKRDGNFLPIQECPLFIRGEKAFIEKLQQLIQSFHFKSVKQASVRVFFYEGCYHLAFSFFPKAPVNFEKVAQKNANNYFKIVAKAPQFTYPKPLPKLSFSINQSRFYVSPYGFIQNQIPGMTLLYNRVLELIAAWNPSSILDLYCGTGILTILMAQKLKAPIDAIELSREAIECARINQKNHAVPHVRFFAMAAEEIGKQKPQTYSVAVVNPPREGLDFEVARYLASHVQKAIIYISCHPATLARDVKRFCEWGFDIDSLEYFDLFPQTYHVESVIVIKKPA